KALREGQQGVASGIVAAAAARGEVRAGYDEDRPALISKSYSMGVFTVGQWPPRVRPEFVSE
ncbi:hypothetical protein ABT329_27205, partial [Streptomyces minutiscleroticus]